MYDYDSHVVLSPSAKSNESVYTSLKRTLAQHVEDEKEEALRCLHGLVLEYSVNQGWGLSKTLRTLESTFLLRVK